MLLRAFAKINLDLRVLHRRPDGYHEVRTILQTVDWHDEIRMESADRFEFVAYGSPPDDANLVVSAVREFESITGRTVNLQIHLTKKIPMGAGLGGGSSDAAATVLGLQKILGVKLSDSDQLRCLRALGSDVPFFAVGGRALGTGRGDEVLPLDDDDQLLTAYAAIVNPGILVSTKEAYSWLTRSPGSNSIEGFCEPSVPGGAGRSQTNDFEAVVFARYPMLAEIKGQLLRSGARNASLSGSGSAIFGIFRTRDEALGAASSMPKNSAVHVCPFLTRTEYMQRVIGD